MIDFDPLGFKKSTSVPGFAKEEDRVQDEKKSNLALP